MMKVEVCSNFFLFHKLECVYVYVGCLTIPQMDSAIKDIDKILGKFYEKMTGTEQEVKKLKKNLKNSEPATSTRKQTKQILFE